MYFYLLLFSDLLIQEYKNTLLQFIIIYFISHSCEIYLSNLLQFYLSFYPWEIDNPSLTSGCKYLFFVCRYHLHSVAWFSYWFDNLGLITEGNTYRSCVAPSLPLWGNTGVVQAASKGISSAVTGETSSKSIRFLITNLISWQFTLFGIFLSFSSPPLHKKLPFYSPSFLFAVFSLDLFLCAILFA